MRPVFLKRSCHRVGDLEKRLWTLVSGQRRDIRITWSSSQRARRKSGFGPLEFGHIYGCLTGPHVLTIREQDSSLTSVTQPKRPIEINTY